MLYPSYDANVSESKNHVFLFLCSVPQAKFSCLPLEGQLAGLNNCL